MTDIKTTAGAVIIEGLDGMSNPVEVRLMARVDPGETDVVLTVETFLDLATAADKVAARAEGVG
jgi:hypothetical protein